MMNLQIVSIPVYQLETFFRIFNTNPAGLFALGTRAIGNARQMGRRNHAPRTCEAASRPAECP